MIADFACQYAKLWDPRNPVLWKGVQSTTSFSTSDIRWRMSLLVVSFPARVAALPFTPVPTRYSVSWRRYFVLIMLKGFITEPLRLFIALYGLYSPINGRAYYGHLERVEKPLSINMVPEFEKQDKKFWSSFIPETGVIKEDLLWTKFEDWKVTTYRKWTMYGYKNCKCIFDPQSERAYSHDKPHIIRLKSIVILMTSSLCIAPFAIHRLTYHLSTILAKFFQGIQSVALRDGMAMNYLVKMLSHVGSLAATPVYVCGLFLSLLTSLVAPYQGRKYYATFERLLYPGFTLIRCFHPISLERRQIQAIQQQART